MDITKNILIDGETLTVHYNSSDRKKDENGIIEVFPFYKISIIFNDGLEARFVSGDSHVLKTGEIMIFSPYQAHYGKFLRNGHFEYMEIYVPVDFVEKNELFDFLLGIDDSFSVNGEKYIDLIYNFADVCIEREDKISAYLTVFADLLKKLCLNRLKGSNTKTPPIIKEAIEYISRDFINIKSVKQIALKCACSEKYLTESFKKQMGLTAYEYLIKTKLNNAKGILLSGGSVTNACYDSGFTDYSHFIQLFKKNYGITPNKYKSS